MTRAVERFADGELAAGLPLERQDEIGILARRFYRMRQQIRQQIAELNCRREEMENLARHDPLTGLANRRLLVERAEHAFTVARRDNQRLGLLFINLIVSSKINNNLGRAMGDLCSRPSPTASGASSASRTHLRASAATNSSYCSK